MNPNPSHVASDALDHNMDSRIDRALSGLRGAQPRSGLNARILASLEQRTTAPQPARAYLSGHIVVWAATSGAILAIASLIVLHRRPEPGQITYTTQTHVHSQTQAVAVVRSRTGSRPTSTEPTLSTSRHPEQSAAKRRTSVFEPCPDHQPTGCPIHDGAVVMSGVANDLDAQALIDLHTPSHPAPPLPLTPQEKLFLHMLQYGNATELAELDPVVRAKEDADETTSYKAFFPDPPPLKQPLGDTE